MNYNTEILNIINIFNIPIIILEESYDLNEIKVVAMNYEFHDFCGYETDDLEDAALNSQMNDFFLSTKDNKKNRCVLYNKQGNSLEVEVLTSKIIIKGKNNYILQFIEVKDEYANFNQSHYNTLIDKSPEFIYYVGPNGRIIDISYSCQDLIKYSREELFDQHFSTLIYKDDLPKVYEYFNKVMGNETVKFEFRINSKDNSIIYFEASAIPVLDEDGITHILGIARDVTYKKEVENKLLESEQLYRSLFDDNVDAVITFDLEGRFAYVNKATEELMGYKKEDLIGNSFLPYIVEDRQEYTIKEFMKVLDGKSIQYETAMYNSKMEIIELHITVIPVMLNGEIKGIHCIGKDITLQKRAEETLKEMAYYDYLTRLPNQYSLNSYIKSMINSKVQFGIMMIDLDRFKNINDNWGHETGDILLKEVSYRLLNGLPNNARVFRYGGDEYIITIKHGSYNELISVAKSVQNLFRESFVLNGIEVYVSASIGISLFPEDGESIDVLFKKADNAMYYSKKHGRNNMLLYKNIEKEQDDQLTKIEPLLRNAINNNELFLVYQPQIDLSTKCIDGVEVLLRWNNPVLGNVSPYRFIPIAEDSGLIIDIGNWVLRNACQQLSLWINKEINNISISINISIHQFYQADFVRNIKNVVDEYKIPPELVVLEITESIASNSDVILAKLNALKDIGIKISIDDFGTGYSSLKYLKEFPIDYLKIDKSFVQGIGYNSKDQDIVETIIMLAKNLGLQTIAEGTETQDEINFLRDKNCNLAQGYYYCKPIIAEKFERWLKDYEACKK